MVPPTPPEPALSADCGRPTLWAGSKPASRRVASLVSAPEKGTAASLEAAGSPPGRKSSPPTPRSRSSTPTDWCSLPRRPPSFAVCTNSNPIWLKLWGTPRSLPSRALRPKRPLWPPFVGRSMHGKWTCRLGFVAKVPNPHPCPLLLLPFPIAVDPVTTTCLVYRAAGRGCPLRPQAFRGECD
jgi:hypothetical protein